MINMFVGKKKNKTEPRCPRREWINILQYIEKIKQYEVTKEEQLRVSTMMTIKIIMS